MNRFEQLFEKVRKESRKALVGYLTAGDPDDAASLEVLRTAVRSGVDILEIGVPFSDPTADGPVIQAAACRALANGFDLRRILAMVSALRRETEVPVVLFGYAIRFYRFGYDALCSEARAAGVDGLLVVDMPLEESDEFRAAAGREGLCWIPLIAPTTPPERARAILEVAGGFVYYIMVTGVTGERHEMAADVAEQVRAIRRLTPLPIAVGFGVSNGAQARQAGKSADAVVVGSALVRAAHDGKLEPLVRELRSALTN